MKGAKRTTTQESLIIIVIIIVPLQFITTLHLSRLFALMKSQ